MRDEAELAGAREGHLAELFATVDLRHIQPSKLTVSVRFETFADWWEPFTFGVGPAGDYVAHLDDAQRGALRARCAEVLPLPPAPFELSASAWHMQARA